MLLLQPLETPRRDCAVGRNGFTRKQLTADFHKGVDPSLLPVRPPAHCSGPTLARTPHVTCSRDVHTSMRRGAAWKPGSLLVGVSTVGLNCMMWSGGRACQVNRVGSSVDFEFPCFCVSAVDYQVVNALSSRMDGASVSSAAH